MFYLLVPIQVYIDVLCVTTDRGRQRVSALWKIHGFSPLYDIGKLKPLESSFHNAALETRITLHIHFILF